MSKVQRTRPILLWSGLILAIGLIAVKAGPLSTLAQEEGTGPHQVFLPYVIDGVAPATALTTLDGGDGHTHSHPQPQRESWPPQPEGLADVVWLASVPSAEVVAAEGTIRVAEQRALTAETVQAALGERFTQASTTYLYEKSTVKGATAGAPEQKAAVRITYFSYSHNATVEAIVEDGVVTDVRTMAAAVYQPEPTAGEKARAIELARRYFAAQGFVQINALQGYVIQAYQPEGTTGFYENRVLYVTFHERIDERPEFVAWVDLTQEVVSKGFQDHYQVTPNEEVQR